MDEVRLHRTESVIRDIVSQMILRGSIKDPRVNTLLSITEVKASKDLAHATIYVSSLNTGTSLEKGVAGLNSASGYIQRELGKRMKTRVTPKIKFTPDRSAEIGFEINKTLSQITLSEESE